MLETTAATAARPARGDQDGEIEDIDFNWRPEPLDRALGSDRSFRWPIVIAALFIGVSVALVLRLFVLAPANAAAVRLDEYRSVAADLDAALREVIDAPAGDPDAASDLAEAAASLQASLAPPLPGGPIGGQGPSGELAAAHQTLRAIADSATNLSARLQLATEYRRNADAALTLPLLPTEAPEDLIASAERTLADYRAGAVAAMARFTDEAAFGDLRDQFGTFVDGLQGWSDQYLLSLRRGETETTTELLQEARTETGRLRAILDTRLESVEGNVAADSLALLSALQQASFGTG
ncbi:MAG: hypothetical protein WEA29_03695 [Acidimicrobiia bacterium]